MEPLFWGYPDETISIMQQDCMRIILWVQMLCLDDKAHASFFLQNIPL